MSSNIKASVQRDSWQSQDKNTTSTYNFNTSTLHSASICKLLKHKKSQWLHSKHEKAGYYRMKAKWHHAKNTEYVWNGWMHYVNRYFSVKCISHGTQSYVQVFSIQSRGSIECDSITILNAREQKHTASLNYRKYCISCCMW